MINGVIVRKLEMLDIVDYVQRASDEDDQPTAE